MRNHPFFKPKRIHKRSILFISAFFLGAFSQSLLPTKTTTLFSQITLPQLEMKSCFTPQQKCLPLIIDEINQAKKTLLMQCYSFTSQEIAEAILNAHERGVKILIITDKSQFKDSYYQIHALLNKSIDIFVDSKPSIAHNKLILIDNLTTYNFTNAAEYRNTENVTIIKNKEWTNLFIENFYRRKNVSVQWKKRKKR